MAREDITIRTPDGECRSAVYTPSAGSGPWPAVIVYMDALGVRDTLHRMSQRLADAGYVVLLPDLYYRLGEYEPIDPKALFASPDIPGFLAPYRSSMDNRRSAADTASFLDYLATRSDVAGDKVGTTGYCMGGGISMTVAGTYPDRIAVAASFHGGGLASDADLSPHLLASEIKGHLYIAAADNDPLYPPEMAGLLCQTLMAHSIDHRHELYVGAAHGWTMTDREQTYNPAAAERHWRELLGVFGAHLG